MKRLAILSFCMLAYFATSAVADEAKPDSASAPAPTEEAPTPAGGGQTGETEPDCQ